MDDLEVKCPACKAGLSGTTEDELIHEVKEHVEKEHPGEDENKLLNTILGMIRN